MSEKIEPALSAESWSDEGMFDNGSEFGYIPGGTDCVVIGQSGHSGIGLGRNSAPQFIALFNAALPDSDPRKITREMVNIIREAGKRIGREGNQYLGFERNLLNYADALESYLPPES